MTPNGNGIMAAPNKILIEAKVLSLSQSDKFQDKWLLDLEILKSENMSGPNLANVGDTVKAFIVGPFPRIACDAIISAEAEYIGTPLKGVFQLEAVEIVT